jgi:hypothetical protein
LFGPNFSHRFAADALPTSLAVAKPYTIVANWPDLFVLVYVVATLRLRYLAVSLVAAMT